MCILILELLTNEVQKVRDKETGIISNIFEMKRKEKKRKERKRKEKKGKEDIQCDVRHSSFKECVLKV